MSGKAKLKESNAFPQGKRNQDLLQRLNHLYQANIYLASVSRQLAGSASSLPPAQCQISEEPHNRNKARKARRTNKREKEDALAVVTRRSNQRFKVMVKHNTLHTDPSLKRSFCKGCNAICVPGLNARVRVKSSRVHGNKLITTCLTCSTTRTIPAPPTQTMPGPLEVSSSPELDVITREEKNQAGGVHRIEKRYKLASKTPFWRKEAPAPPGPAQDVKQAVSGDSGTSHALSDSGRNDSVSTENINPDALAAEAVSTASLDNNTAFQPHVVDSSDVPAISEAVSLTSAAVPSTGTDTSKSTRAPKQKQTKAQKQKGKNAAEGDAPGMRQDGHHIWRGEELVTGWGDPTAPRYPASSM